MTVKFKTIKYKHYRKGLKMTAEVDETEDVPESDRIEMQDRHFRFLLGLVKYWDFVDADTGETLPVGEDSIDELSMEQLNEITTIFNKQFEDDATVPKETAGRSPSTSTRKDQVEILQRQTDLTGYRPSF